MSGKKTSELYIIFPALCRNGGHVKVASYLIHRLGYTHETTVTVSALGEITQRSQEINNAIFVLTILSQSRYL